jgi:hypothetical protein
VAGKIMTRPECSEVALQLGEPAEAIEVGLVQRLASMSQDGALNQLFQASFFNPSFGVEANTPTALRDDVGRARVELEVIAGRVPIETLEPDENADAHVGRPRHSDDEPFAWLKIVRAASALPRGTLHHWAVMQEGAGDRPGT